VLDKARNIFIGQPIIDAPALVNWGRNLSALAYVSPLLTRRFLSAIT